MLTITITMFFMQCWLVVSCLTSFVSSSCDSCSWVVKIDNLLMTWFLRCHCSIKAKRSWRQELSTCGVHIACMHSCSLSQSEVGSWTHIIYYKQGVTQIWVIMTFTEFCLLCELRETQECIFYREPYVPPWVQCCCGNKVESMCMCMSCLTFGYHSFTSEEWILMLMHVLYWKNRPIWN